MQMQRERALIPKVGLVIRSSELVDQEKRQKSAVSGSNLGTEFSPLVGDC